MFSQQPDQKNLLLAIALSIGVLLAWQYFYAGPKLKKEQERQRQLKEAPGTQQPSAPGAANVPTPKASDSGVVPRSAAKPQAPAVAVTRSAALRSSPRVAIENEALGGSIALKGARIDDLKLLKYRETVDPESPNVTLFSPSGSPKPYYAEQGWVTANPDKFPTPGSQTLWTQESNGPLTPSRPVVLKWNNGKGLVFRRTIQVDENYLFNISDQVENNTGAEVTLFPYALIARHGTPKVSGIYILHEGLIGIVGDSGLMEISYSELTGEIDENTERDPSKVQAIRKFDGATTGWLGITDKYWAAALIPKQTIAYDARLWAWRDAGKNFFQVDFRQPGVTIAPGSKGQVSSQLFAGAKDVNVIDGYAEKFNIKQFGYLIDWGTFWYITKPLFYLLDWINKIVGNFGVAILIATVLVKLVFFPLANKSYESMARMKKLQPEMERIRDRFKDDKARQQQELMALYKKEKINPLAGCLPILVQIPVFFALYKVLFVSLEMRHAPFFGWIKDLSAPDPTSVFNLFGLLPVPPIDMMILGYTIGAWAVVMGLTMWLQMQLNPQQPDPTQQMIFNWMPVMFTFLLGGFASGLVIYWAWSNMLSIAQQWLIMKRNGVEIALVDNLKRTFSAVMGLFGRRNPS